MVGYVRAIAPKESYEGGRCVRVACDEVSTRCGSKPIGERFQLACIVQSEFETEPVGDRSGRIASTLVVGGVDMCEAGVLEYLREELSTFPPDLGERRVRGIVQLFGVPNEVYHRGFLLGLSWSRHGTETGGEQKRTRANADGKQPQPAKAGGKAGRKADRSKNRWHVLNLRPSSAGNKDTPSHAPAVRYFSVLLLLSS